MTEEIIIDGVDVAGCFYFIDHTPPKGQGDWCGAIHKGACKVYSKDCEYNKDCYYKQRKRLEKENKELKEENERLKKDFSSYEDDIEDWVSDNSILYQYDDRTPDTLEELQACMESTHEQWQKYKQALEEIKDICQDESDTCTGECGNFNVAQRVLDVLCNLEG